MIKKYQRFFSISQVMLDAVFIALAYACSVVVKLKLDQQYVLDLKYKIGPVWMVPLLLVTYFFMNTYSPMRSTMYRKEVLAIFRAHLVGLVLIYSILFLKSDLGYSRELSITFGFSSLLFVLFERYIIRYTLRHFRQRGYNAKNMLIIGAGPVGLHFADKVLHHLDFGYRIIGFLDDDESKHEISILGRPVLGPCQILPKFLESQSVDEVVVALPLSAFHKYSKIVEECENAGVRIRIIPDYIQFLPGNPKIEEFDGIPLINIRHIPLDDPFNNITKRLFDVLFSSVAILLVSPVLLFVAIGIKLTSPGPIFFKQERVGLNNKSFNMLKFRSMRVDDDKTASTTWTTANDPRKTKFGSFLRKTSLDELPQFLNVLLGSMSVVGPRPERPYFVEQFKIEIEKYMVKHQVKPGITGWAQVNGWRGDTSIEKRIECDIYYIENWDLLFDIKIIFLTVFKGFVNKNAY